jgi:hypothetical protein
VTDEAGKPVASVTVSAVGGGPGGQTYSGKTSAAGAFTFSGVAPGAYSICVQEPGGTRLDPCHWGNGTAVTVSAAKAATVAVPVKTGVVLTARLNDPNHLLKPGPAGPLDALVGVMLPSTLFHPMRLTGSDANGYTYQITVPYGVPVKISITSAHFSIADSTGASIAAASVSAAASGLIPVTVLVGQAAAPLTFTITGRK